MEFVKCLFADTAGDLFMSNPLLPFTLICVLALRLGYRPIAVKEWLCRSDIGHGKHVLPRRCKLATFLIKGRKPGPEPKRKCSRSKPTPGVRGGVAKLRKAKSYRSVLPKLRFDPHPHVPSSVVGAMSTSTLRSEQHGQPTPHAVVNNTTTSRCEPAAAIPSQQSENHRSNTVVITNLPPSLFSQTWVMDFCETEGEGADVLEISLDENNRVAQVELGSDAEAAQLVESGRAYIGELGANISLA